MPSITGEYKQIFQTIKKGKLQSTLSDAHNQVCRLSVYRDCERAFVLVPAQAFVGNWLSSFADFPPRQKPGSFSLSQVMDKLTETPST